MFKKILVANRGEIAVRILRACREMGINTVAVYSQADRDAMHALLADEAICIGPPLSKDSYLNMQNILSATVLTGAEAIHPGFGFLSENSKFARMCAACNIKFIGPSPQSMDQMGHKMRARATMIAAGVPVIPGSTALLASLQEAKDCAGRVGYPVMVKAAAGGGGRGIRRVEDESELQNAIETAKAEAMACFGDDGLYMEKCITRARHVEVQVLADEFGNVVQLGERDCSLQRRNQKMIEEAPCAVLDPELRAAMGEAAVTAAKAADYQNAGTIEFLLTPDGAFYFLEMNTRVQVEHPVSEMVTGIDIVQGQIRIAAGLPLSFTQEDITLRGHAIECRILAESPENGFRPSCGTVESLHIPGGPGVRFDTYLYPGYKIPPHYDSMIGKLIVHAPTREAAIAKMRGALTEMDVFGVDTNLAYLLKLIDHPEFHEGNVSTVFIEEMIGTL